MEENITAEIVVPPVSETNSGETKQTPKYQKFLIALLVVLAVCAVGAYAVSSYIMSSLDNALSTTEMKTDKALSAALEVDEEEPSMVDTFYALIVGSDQRKENTDDPGRSDVMIIARVAPEENTISLLSLPRDIMVEDEVYGTEKLNAAYAHDGLAGTVKKIKELTHIPITHCAEINFEQVEDAIDSLGGVDVDVPVANDETGGTSIDIIEEGIQHMDGETALQFARERYGYERGDFQRSDNQRLIISAVINKVLQKPAIMLPSVIGDLVGCVKTDLTSAEILNMARLFEVEDLNIYSAIAPCDTGMLGDTSYDFLDEEQLEKMVKLFKAGKDMSVAESGDSASNVNANENENGNVETIENDKDASDIDDDTEDVENTEDDDYVPDEENFETGRQLYKDVIGNWSKLSK